MPGGIALIVLPVSSTIVKVQFKVYCTYRVGYSDWTVDLALPAGLPAAELRAGLIRRGFARLRVDGAVVELEAAALDDVREAEVVLDRVVLDLARRARLTESIETALREGGGEVSIDVVGVGVQRFAVDFRCAGAEATPFAAGSFDCLTANQCWLYFDRTRDEPIHFTRDTWRGRIRACRGIGAALSTGEVERFDAEHDTVLKDIAGERFTVLHRIVCHMLRFKV